MAKKKTPESKKNVKQTNNIELSPQSKRLLAYNAILLKLRNAIVLRTLDSWPTRTQLILSILVWLIPTFLLFCVVVLIVSPTFLGMDVRFGILLNWLGVIQFQDQSNTVESPSDPNNDTVNQDPKVQNTWIRVLVSLASAALLLCLNFYGFDLRAYALMFVLSCFLFYISYTISERNVYVLHIFIGVLGGIVMLMGWLIFQDTRKLMLNKAAKEAFVDATPSEDLRVAANMLQIAELQRQLNEVQGSNKKSQEELNEKMVQLTEELNKYKRNDKNKYEKTLADIRKIIANNRTDLYDYIAAQIKTLRGEFDTKLSSKIEKKDIEDNLEKIRLERINAIEALQNASTNLSLEARKKLDDNLRKVQVEVYEIQAKMREKMLGISTSIDSLTNQTKDLTKSTSEKMDVLDEKQQEIQNKLNELKASGEYIDQEQEIKKLNENLSAVESLKTQLQSTQKNLEELQENDQKTKEDLTKVKESTNKLRKELKNMPKDLSDEVAGLSSELKNYESRITTLQNESKAYTKNLNEMDQANKTFVQTRVNELQKLIEQETGKTNTNLSKLVNTVRESSKNFNERIQQLWDGTVANANRIEQVIEGVSGLKGEMGTYIQQLASYFQQELQNLENKKIGEAELEVFKEEFLQKIKEIDNKMEIIPDATFWREGIEEKIEKLSTEKATIADLRNFIEKTTENLSEKANIAELQKFFATQQEERKVIDEDFNKSFEGINENLQNIVQRSNEQEQDISGLRDKITEQFNIGAKRRRVLDGFPQGEFRLGYT